MALIEEQLNKEKMRHIENVKAWIKAEGHDPESDLSKEFIKQTDLLMKLEQKVRMFAERVDVLEEQLKEQQVALNEIDDEKYIDDEEKDAEVIMGHVDPNTVYDLEALKKIFGRGRTQIYKYLGEGLKKCNRDRGIRVLGSEVLRFLNEQMNEEPTIQQHSIRDLRARQKASEIFMK